MGTMSFESMWAPVLEWMGMSADDYNEVLPNWQNAGTDMIPMSVVYGNNTLSASQSNAMYGQEVFLRIKNSLIWLEDSYGEASYTSDPGDDDKETYLNHVWIIRSTGGSGLRTDVDPKDGQCIKYDDKIYIQSNRIDNQWLSGGRNDGNNDVKTRNIYEETNKRYHYEWIVASSKSIYGESQADPKSGECVGLRDNVYFRQMLVNKPDPALTYWGPTRRPSNNTLYLNDWDGDLDFNEGKPLCGMESKHDNGREDRLFALYKCSMKEGQQYRQTVGNAQTIALTNYDETFQLTCDQNKVMVGLYSHHDNGPEDRQWRATCVQYKDTYTDNCVSSPDNTEGYFNEYDATFDYKCPTGKVLTGLDSKHSNFNEDRKFKFTCGNIVPHRNRWLTGGGAWSDHSGFWTDVQSGDHRSGSVSSYYYKWSFEAHQNS